jgi:hypothetical protein
MKDMRVAALARFATAITVLTTLGHAFLGFEPSYAAVPTALASAYGCEILLEWITAWSEGRAPRFLGGFRKLVEFLLPAHITGLACAMLLYTSSLLWPVVFAAAIGIASKTLFRVKIRGSSRHFLNPSNTGIAVTMAVFPWITVTPPYQFTENIHGVWDWVVPGVIICTGSFLNTKFTRRIPLILGWLLAFATLRAPQPRTVRRDDRRRVLAVHVLHGAGPGHDADGALAAVRVRCVGRSALRRVHRVSYRVRHVLRADHRVHGARCVGVGVRQTNRRSAGARARRWCG